MNSVLFHEYYDDDDDNDNDAQDVCIVIQDTYVLSSYLLQTCTWSASQSGLQLPFVELIFLAK